MVSELTQMEKDYFDGLKEAAGARGRLVLSRMVLNGEDVAVVSVRMRNRVTGKHEGLMPLAMLLDDDTIENLREPDGKGPVSVSPYDVE